MVSIFNSSSGFSIDSSHSQGMQMQPQRAQREEIRVEPQITQIPADSNAKESPSAGLLICVYLRNLRFISPHFLRGLCVLCGLCGLTSAQQSKPVESDYYQIIKIPIPSDIVLECGGMEWMPDGKLAVSTRRGDIYCLENPLSPNVKRIRFTKWATGLHEVMGLAYNKNDGHLYAIQRGEITRLKDTDGRGHANVYETYCDDWGISGDYHEYPWMSKFDKDGNLWVLLTLTGSFTSDARFRGWCLRVRPDGTILPTCSGIRSPGGIAFNDKGEVFYDDNQ